MSFYILIQTRWNVEIRRNSMARTGCYVCNFNGKEYVMNCISSVLKQSEIDEDFYLCLVDNASTDDSVSCVQHTFRNKVDIIINPVNSGGAGGFNTALKDAVKKGFDYVILLDNDIILAQDCIFNLISYIDRHNDVGCIGAKIMMMDHPEYMQEFGVHLDFEHYCLRYDYRNEWDSGTEEVIESDCVASCALIARVECLKKTKLFPEENFLYWDDLEFTYQIKLAGYKVISLASAVAYHKGKKKPGTNTVPGYYGMRNRVKFFAKYEKEEKLSYLCKNILEDCFAFFFGSAMKGFLASNSSRMFALDDFVHKHYGKIDPQKVFPMDEKEDSIWQIVKNEDIVYIEFPYEEKTFLMEAVGSLFRRFDEMNNIKQVLILLESNRDVETAKVELKKYYEKEVVFVTEIAKKGYVFRPCSHFTKVSKDISPIIWFDKYLNCIKNHEDFKYIKAYPYLKDFFVNMHYEWLMQGILEERKR